MRILFWHGYLLAGSGSNLLAANLVRVWRSQGHEVLLLCQDRAAAQLPFVDAAGAFAPDNARCDLTATGHSAAAGSLAVACPDIGGLLPVYVYDHYSGFEVKTFLDLTDAELGSYVTANVTALVTAAGEHRPDVIVVGHEVMGPYIARLAARQTGYGYTALIHGSATLFVVSKQQRYVRYARDGLAGATAVVGGTGAVVAKTEQAIGTPISSVHVINPGCNVELFGPVERAGDAPPTAGYVGKFIASKGVQNLLTALGLTTTPGLRCQIVGFDTLEPTLHELAAVLREHDPVAVRKVIETAPEPLADVAAFLDSQTPDDSYGDRIREVSLTWLGRLEHEALSAVLPQFDVLVVPSVAPEAFGMVAAEAAAAGVLPIVANHTGLAEVGAAIESELVTLGVPGLATFDPADPIRGIARCLDAYFALGSADRAEISLRLIALARRQWSWDVVAQRLLAVAAGSASRRRKAVVRMRARMADRSTLTAVDVVESMREIRDERSRGPLA
ncbi:MAG: glycosyltransferase [Mycobacteriales bacterium]